MATHIQMKQPGSEGGRHVHDLFAAGGEQLGDAAAKTGGAFDGEASLRPSGRQFISVL